MPLPSTGLLIHLKADAIVGLNDGDPVATWEDSSSNNNDATQGSAGNRPTYQTNEINGLPVVRFDGSNDFLNLVDLSALTSAEIFFVLKVTNTSGGHLLGTAGSNHYPFSGDSNLYESFGTNARKDGIAPGVTVSNFHRYSIYSAAGDYAMFHNGSSIFSTASNTVAFSAAPKIGDNGSLNFIAGDIAEIILYDHKLSSGDRTAVQEYLAGKYFSPTVTTTTLPDGTIDSAYSQTLAVTGGTGSITWTITAGALPTGLSLNASTGAITGTATVAGAFSFTVRATDAAAAYDEQALSITILALNMFPLDFSKLSSGPEFSTTVTTNPLSGHEQRIKHRARARDRFNAAFAVKSIEDAHTLRDFFLNKGGKFQTFLLKDFLDYTSERITTEDVGDGSQDEFQIRKAYTDIVGNVYHRDLKHPRNGTVTVWVDDAEVDGGVDYEVDYDTGVITFDTPPGVGDLVEVECEFYKNVRFDTDFLDMEILAFWVQQQTSSDYGHIQPPDIPLVEVFS